MEPLFAPQNKVIQVDISADGIGGDRRPELSIVGDVRRVVRALCDGYGKSPASREGWLKESRDLAGFLLGTWDQQIAGHKGKRVHAGQA